MSWGAREGTFPVKETGTMALLSSVIENNTEMLNTSFISGCCSNVKCGLIVSTALQRGNNQGRSPTGGQQCLSLRSMAKHIVLRRLSDSRHEDVGALC